MMFDDASLTISNDNEKDWPWYFDKPIDPHLLPNTKYPKITVLTPNYNYGKYLEETIRSVILQGYPNLEYIVMDGGSTDNSVEILKKYEPWIAYWESEPDRGQTHAINKGLARATGEIFNWINSDDILMPGALFAIAQGIEEYDAFAGVVNNFDDRGNEEKIFSQNITAEGLLTKFKTNKPSRGDTLYHQPGLWFKTEYLRNIGSFNEKLNIQFDLDRVVRYLHKYPRVNYSDLVLVNFRCHDEQKTAPGKVKQEGQIIAKSIIADPAYQAIHIPARLWLSRLIWYERIAEIMQQDRSSQFLQAVQILLLSCRNPSAYWTRYTFGSIKLLLTK